MDLAGSGLYRAGGKPCAQHRLYGSDFRGLLPGFCAGAVPGKRWLSLLKAAGLTVLLNLWFLVPFLYFYLKENLYTESLDWSGYSEYSINAAFLLDTFHTNGYRFLSLGLPVLGLAAVCVLWIFVEKKEEAVGKSMAWNRENRFLTFLFWMACVLSFLVTGYFGSRKLMELLPVLAPAFRTIQFPWRLLAPAGVLFIFAGAVWLSVPGCCIRTES